jgi:hypothetical protein
MGGFMKKLYSLALVGVLALSSILVKGVTPETKDCLKVYSAGLAVGVAGAVVSPFGVISKLGFMVGSPITSGFKILGCAAGAPLSYLMGKKFGVEVHNKEIVAVRFNSKQLAHYSEEFLIASGKKSMGSAAADILTVIALKRSVPAVIGFGVVPGLLKKYREQNSAHDNLPLVG